MSQKAQNSRTTRSGGNQRNTQSLVTEAQLNSRIQKALNRNLEDKLTYREVLASGIDYSGSNYNLTLNIARGDGPIDAFTGNIIMPKRLIVRFNLDASASTYNLMRVLTVQFENAGTLAPAGTFQSTGSASAPLSPINWENRSLLRIHYDHLFKVSSTIPNSVGGAESVPVCQTITLGGFSPMHFVSTSTAITRGSIWLCCISDDAAATYPTIDFTSELIFSDA